MQTIMTKTKGLCLKLCSLHSWTQCYCWRKCFFLMCCRLGPTFTREQSISAPHLKLIDRKMTIFDEKLEWQSAFTLDGRYYRMHCGISHLENYQSTLYKLYHVAQLIEITFLNILWKLLSIPFQHSVWKYTKDQRYKLSECTLLYQLSIDNKSCFMDFFTLFSKNKSFTSLFWNSFEMEVHVGKYPWPLLHWALIYFM